MSGKPGLSDSFLALLDQADRRNGLPVGTMRSVMTQEVGSNASQYLQDPGRYHYAADATGRRIAPHSGQASSAFGPFGILESTARDPGYGVTPLKNKTLEEQVRFASDYLGARIKQAGSLEAGLAGYGKGPGYARQVLGRLDQSASPRPEASTIQHAPVVASNSASEPARIEPAPVIEPAAAPEYASRPVAQDLNPVYQASSMGAPTQWDTFIRSMPSPRIEAFDLARWLGALGTPAAKPNLDLNKGFATFEGWKARV